MKNKLLIMIYIVVILVHFTVLSYRFFSNQNSKKVKKVSTAVKLKRVILPKQKKIKKIVKKHKAKLKPIPAPSFEPITFEELIEKEEELDFEEELYVDLEEEIIFIEETELETVSSIDIDKIKQAYINLIYININKYKTYPSMAKRLNQQGTVEVAFTILKNGLINNVRVFKSSKFSAIDKAAIKAVSKIKSLKPIPKELNKQEWELILPIKYELF